MSASSSSSETTNLSTQAVAYEHAGTPLEGFLVWDEKKISSAAKAPAVLIIPEWWGVVDYVRRRAREVAALGYVAFVADMYGKGVTTDDPKKAGQLAGQFYGKPLMAERAQAGLDQLVKTGLADPARIAAIGYCFGGSTTQALAWSGAALTGIVSFHGGLIPVPADAAKKNRAKILICHGAIDSFVSDDDVAVFKKSMDEGKFDYQFISYAQALHAFTNPDADRHHAAGLTGVKYNRAADLRSWEHMKVFFHEVLA